MPVPVTPRLLETLDDPDLRLGVVKMAGELERILTALQFDSRITQGGGGSITGGGGITTGGGGGGNTIAGGLSTLYASAVAAESGITLNSWVHVRGAAAFLATATSIDRYATGIVVSISPGDRLTVASFGKQTARCIVYANSAEPRLWLSSTPGWAQDTQPAEGSGYIAQQLGIKASAAVVNSRAEVLVDIMRWDQLAGT